jgi:hypothetical protein
MTNSLRASSVWPRFLDQQAAVTSLKHTIRVTWGIVKLSLSHAWPLVVLTPLFALVGLGIMQGKGPTAWHVTGDSAREIFLGGMERSPSGDGPSPSADKAPQRNVNQETRDWKTSLEGQALGLFGDVLSKIVGGYFAIVGLGLGIVMLRHGVRVDPQRMQR